MSQEPSYLDHLSAIPDCIPFPDPAPSAPSLRVPLKTFLVDLNQKVSQVPDDRFTQEDYERAKILIPRGFHRQISFGVFQDYIQKYIKSQMCTPACLGPENRDGRPESLGCPEEPKIPRAAAPVKKRSPKLQPEKTVESPPPAEPQKETQRPPSDQKEVDRWWLDRLDPEDLPPAPKREDPTGNKIEKLITDAAKEIEAARREDAPKLPTRVIKMPNGDLTVKGMTLVRKNPDGSVVLENSRKVLGYFQVIIHADGSLDFKDKTSLVIEGGGLVIGLDDLLERIVTGRNSSTEYAKIKFLEATFEERLLMHQKQEALEKATALKELKLKLLEIAESPFSWEVKKLLLFRLWDDFTPEARGFVLDFIRLHFPKNSPQAFRADEITSLNQKRTEKELPPFDPYPEAL